jgi:hypothetical protein
MRRTQVVRMAVAVSLRSSPSSEDSPKMSPAVKIDSRHSLPQRAYICVLICPLSIT